MSNLLRLVFAGLAIVVVLSGVAQANLITNGSFEEGDYLSSDPFITLGAGSTSISGWTVKSGSVDWIDSYWQASNGSRSLDLAGYYEHGVISTIFATTPGQTYRVQFDMAGNPDRDYSKTMVAVSAASAPTVNTLQSYSHVVALIFAPPPPLPAFLPAQTYTFEQTGHTRENMGWQTRYFDFIAETASTELFFGDLTGMSSLEDNPDEAYGAALDNVRVTPVPEPSTFLLLGAGLAGIGLLRRRSRR